MTKRTDAMNRLTALRAAGVPLVIPSGDAWYLSGGVAGERDGTGTVPLATIARDVPDCLAFLPDYLEHVAGE